MIARIWHGAPPSSQKRRVPRSSPIDGDPVVNDRREQFPEQQRDGVGQHPVQKQNRELAIRQIKSLVVRPSKDVRSLPRSLDTRPQDERHPNEETQRVARPKRSQLSLPSHRFWFCNPARASPTLAERISIFGDEAVEEPSCTAKREALSQCADEPCRREQTRQASDGIPADMDFACGGDDMQLSQAFIHLESGIDR